MKKIITVGVFSFILSFNTAFAAVKPVVSLPAVSLSKTSISLPATPASTIGKVQNMNPLTLSRSVVGVPMTSGNYIVWQDKRNFGVTGFDIYGMYRDTGIEFAICTAINSQSAPYIDGDVVAWTDNSTSSQGVHAYRISIKNEITLANIDTTNSKNAQVQGISGNIILWYDLWTYNNANTYRIIAYDYVKQTPPITIASSIKNVPSAAIDGNIIVWTDNRDANNNYHIYAYDLSSSKKIAVSTSTAIQSSPTVSDGTIVWTDYRNGKGEIWGYDISTGKESLIYSPSTGSVSSVHVGKRYVVFAKDNAISAYHIDTKVLTTLSNGSHQYDNPSIKNNFVVWTDDTEANANIFTATLPDVPAVKSFVVEDGAAQRFYVDKLQWTFNTNTNIPQLIYDGSIVNAVKITNLGTRAKTSPVNQELKLNASDFSYSTSTNTLTWSYHATSTVKNVPVGLYKATLFASYITSWDNTHLVGDTVNYFHSLKGDANGDMIVDRSDLAIFSDSFGSKIGDANWNPNVDFNKNLSVDVMDYLELKMDFGTYVETL